MYRNRNGAPEVLLAHPGGPFWAKKDEGAWSVPKGEFDGEMPLAAARREFEEETGIRVDGGFIALAPVKLKSGKQLYIFALQGDLDPARVKSNLFELEWPPGSGTRKSFPEIDKAAWFGMDEAKRRISGGQLPVLEQLERLLK